MKKNTKTPDAGDSLKILLLEDSEEDRELITDELKRGQLKFSIRYSRTEVDFVGELNYQTPDIILADYRLPGFSGLDALRITTKNYSAIPFVFLTGSIGEEIAAETILNGASGFVLKSNLLHLNKVIANCLQSNPNKRSQRLKEVSQKIQRRIEQNVDALNRIQQFIELRLSSEGRSSELTKLMTDLNALKKGINDIDQQD